MGKTYLVKFKPLEPYFFGNEKSFIFPKGENKTSNQQLSNSYYIKGENTPSQSTILGALRYILLPVKKSNWNYTEDEKKLNNETVGSKGFSPEDENPNFGVIKNISPVFLCGCSNDDVLAPCPFDHKVENEQYTPFSDYINVETLNGEKCYANDYDAKKGITSGYLNLNTRKVIAESDVFEKETRVGVNRTSTEKGFFKKEYTTLSAQYSFAVYVTLDGCEMPQNTTVFLGQGKSAFSVEFIEQESNLADKVKTVLNDNVVYCLSDCFVESSVYDKTLFAVTKTKTYRSYEKNSNKVTKGTTLYRLITAGSVFIPREKAAFLNSVAKENLNKTGYNTFISK